MSSRVYIGRGQWSGQPRTVVPSKSAPADPKAVKEALETRRRRAEMQAQGMSDDAIEAVFEREWLQRRGIK